MDHDHGAYEGSYVLGLNIQMSGLPAATEVVERWKLGIEEDDLSAKDQCFINVILSQGRAAIKEQDLVPCSRSWPKASIKVIGEAAKESQSAKGVKAPKRDTSKESKSSKKSSSDVGTDAKGVSPVTTKKLRPASDVLSRLRYGGDYDIDEFVVGYKDRHSSELMEKAVAQWAKDTTDEEFIPEHRIEYFKRYTAGWQGEVVWDKSSRLDKIFQHGGSG